MTLVIEDGSNVANANSFVTREEAIAYAAGRGVTIADEDASDVYAIQAMDYLFAQSYIGEIAYEDQTLPFPRKGLIEGDDATDYVYSIPLAIKTAQLQLILDAKNGIILLPSRKAEQKVKAKKVGPIEKEYFEGLDFLPDLPYVTALLRPFLIGSGGFKLRTYRA